MPGRMPPTSQLDWLISTTAMIVLFWSRATRDLLKSFGWGIVALHQLDAATKLPFPRRPPHSISPATATAGDKGHCAAHTEAIHEAWAFDGPKIFGRDSPLEGSGFELSVPRGDG